MGTTAVLLLVCTLLAMHLLGRQSALVIRKTNKLIQVLYKRANDNVWSLRIATLCYLTIRLDSCDSIAQFTLPMSQPTPKCPFVVLCMWTAIVARDSLSAVGQTTCTCWWQCIGATGKI